MTKGIQTKVVFDLDVDSPSPAVLQWAKDHIGEKDKNIKIYELKEMIYGKTNPFVGFLNEISFTTNP